MLSAVGASRPPGFKVVSTHTNTNRNGSNVTFYGVNEPFWEKDDLVLAYSASGSYTNHLTAMSAPPTGFSVIASRYVSDSYDINAVLFGLKATSAGSGLTLAGTAYGGSAHVGHVIVIRGYNGGLPNTSDGSLLVDTGGVNTDDIFWPTLASNSSDNLFILFGGVAHYNDSLRHPNPGDLDYFKANYRADSYDTTASMGYKYADANWTPEPWEIYTGSSYFRSSVQRFVVRLG